MSNHDFTNQRIFPAARSIKEYEKLLRTNFEAIFLLNSHVSQLKSLMQMARSANKKIFLHADLVQGLKTDEYAAQFLCQEIKPAGIISTRKNVVLTAKKNSIIAIQRLFLLDSIALESSYKLLETTKPDYIEVLPGVMPHIITEVYERTQIPIIAGGLIREKQEVLNAIEAGAIGVTTSRQDLWDI
ncbi:glycerol-3-phosphate responsive antiterminator [Halalkalibacter akibai]|uniref:Glycerol uptake operon antiterminator regulatory protein n=1 Tax=Halalkalibacter akibai (strain ATCC 43226 / DSM 21942 / CIP 109018 / JCM 9157 / 1139) TaxID=1236973 RepID=W4QX55_HALA3|nr:glycerol-3-phosphate responsive antiterminator [Halalkalibacter akibai]GAE36233.1 glycerol uptake operon antiterminator regulatory protein [Halalkalibacter akibai JCM 9157]